jgi:hypothetical protein
MNQELIKVYSIGYVTGIPAELICYPVSISCCFIISGFETVYTGPEMEFVCDHLTPGTTYQLRVSCISAGGRSNCSDPCIVTTEAVCPAKCPPPRLHGKPRATTLAIKWSKLLSSNY